MSKRVISFLLILVICVSSVRTNVVRAEETSTPSYDEAAVLDAMARDWIVTCNTIIEKSGEAAALLGVGQIVDNNIEEIYGIGDFSKKATFAMQFSMGEYAGCLKNPDDARRFWEYVATMRDVNAAERDKNFAKTGVRNTVTDKKISDVATILNLVADMAAYITAIYFADMAVADFEQALRSSSILDKRYYMALGAKYGNVACATVIKDIDAMIKDPEISMTDVLDNCFAIIGKSNPVIEITYTAIKITFEFVPVASKINTAQGYIQSYLDGSKNLADDINTFWNAVVNQYGLFEMAFANYEIQLKKYNGYLTTTSQYGDIDIPSVKYTIPVTSLARVCISGGKIYKITIPEEMKRLSAHSISGCDDLEQLNYNAIDVEGTFYGVIINCHKDFEINYGENVISIPNGFLKNCGITSINIPEGVTTTYGHVAISCDDLETVTIPTTIVDMKGLLWKCNNIKKVYYNAKQAKILNSTSHQISECESNFEIIFGEGIENIASGLVYKSGISKLIIPEGVKNVGYNLVVECPAFTYISIPSTVENFYGAVVDNCDLLESVDYKAANTTNKLIGYMFKGNDSDFLMSIAPGVKNIPDYFMNTCGVSDIILPEGLTHTGSYCFTGCNNLKNITIPSTLEEINPRFMDHCNGLENVNYNAKAAVKINTLGAFYFCDSPFTFTIGPKVEAIPSCLFDNSGIVAAEIPEGVKKIGYKAFYKCNNLKKVVVPSTVTEIEKEFLDGCDGLEKVYYNAPEIVNTSGVHLIFCCYGEFKLYIGDNVKKIPRDFITTSGVLNANIPEGVTEIGQDAFKRCNSLHEITIPSTLTTAKSIITECNGVEKFEYNVSGNSSDISVKGILSKCNSNFIVKIGENVNFIPEGFLSSCGVREIDIPENVTKINTLAMDGLDNLEKITIHNPDCDINLAPSTIDANATIYGYTNSTAEAYAKKHNRKFVSIGCNHEFEDDIVPSTCTTKGGKCKACKYCDQRTFYEEFPLNPNAHSYDSYRFDWAEDGSSCNLVYVCEYNNTHKLSYACEITSYEIKAPTCSENGVVRYTATYNGISDSIDIATDKLSHSFENYVSDNNATCEHDGTKTAVCENGCGQTDTIVDKDSKREHSFSQWELVKGSSCEEKSYKIRTCKYCGLSEKSEVDEAGHTWEKAFTVDKKATCEKDGYKSIHCKKCDAIKNRTVIPATGHKWSKAKVIKKATVFKAGVKIYTCKNCGKIKKETIDKLKPTIKITPTKKTLKVKKSFHLLIMKLASGDKVKSVKSNSTNVSVKKETSSIYKITAKKKGKATITVVLKSGKKATCEVTIK